MNCEKKCSNCSMNCNIACPICGKIGKIVNEKTIKSLINKPYLFFESQETFICTTKKCNVIYYQPSNPKYYGKEDVNVPVWYKERYDKYLVCYCRKIYLNDIVEIIKNSNKKTFSKEEILKMLNKSHIVENCEYANPLGSNCDVLFKNAIDFAIKQKKEI